MNADDPVPDAEEAPRASGRGRFTLDDDTPFIPASLHERPADRTDRWPPGAVARTRVRERVAELLATGLDDAVGTGDGG